MAPCLDGCLPVGGVGVSLCDTGCCCRGSGSGAGGPHVRGGSGDVLFSHGAAPTESSGPKSLTTVFGMGTGVPSSLKPPIRPRIQALVSTYRILLHSARVV